MRRPGVTPGDDRREVPHVAAGTGDLTMLDDERRTGPAPGFEDDEELAGADVGGSGAPDALVGGPGAMTGRSGYTTGAGTHGGTDLGGDYPPGGGTAMEGGRTSEPGLDDDEFPTSDAGG